MLIVSKRRLSGVLLVVLTISIAASQDRQSFEISWAKSTPFPEPRADYAAGLLDGHLVIAGGTYWEGSKDHWTKKLYSASTYGFDPSSSTWARLPDLPSATGDVASAVVNNRLFVIGGFTSAGPNRKIYTLSQAKDQWTWRTISELPEDRLFSRAISLQNHLYLIGGLARFEPYDSTGTCCTANSATNSVMVLDAGHPRRGWKQLPPFPASKRWLFAAETDGVSIWLFGGLFQAKAQDPMTRYGEVLRFDVARGTWSPGPLLPEAVRAESPLTAVRVGDKILLVGRNGKVWQFDPRSLQYREMQALPEEAMVDKFVLAGDLVLGGGGENNLQSARKRSDWMFVGKVRPAGKPPERS